MAGLVAALAAILCTAVYQIWVGAKQKELGAGSMQLMHQFQPHATGLLALLVVGLEPLGLPYTLRAFADGTILGYKYELLSVAAILTTAVLGLIVSLSTFLVIGATSSVTYNVVRQQLLHARLADRLPLFCWQRGRPLACPPLSLLGATSRITWHVFLLMRPGLCTAGRKTPRRILAGGIKLGSLPCRNSPDIALQYFVDLDKNTCHAECYGPARLYDITSETASEQHPWDIFQHKGVTYGR